MGGSIQRRKTENTIGRRASREEKAKKKRKSGHGTWYKLHRPAAATADNAKSGNWSVPVIVPKSQSINTTAKKKCLLSLTPTRTHSHLPTHLRTHPRPQAFSPPLPPTGVAGPVSPPPVLSPALSNAEGALGWTSNPPLLTHTRTPSRTHSVTVHATYVRRGRGE